MQEAKGSGSVHPAKSLTDGVLKGRTDDGRLIVHIRDGSLVLVLAIRKVHAVEQIRKAWVGADRIGFGSHPEPDQRCVSLLEGSLVPREGLVDVAKAGIDQCNATGRDVLFARCLQLAEYP